MRITGRVEVLINGNMLLNKAGATASGIGISGEPAMELNPVLGDTGYHGDVEVPVIAQCEVTITDREDISLDQLARLRNSATIVFRAARGGKVYTMEGASCKRNFTITAGEGETPIIFHGAYWTEGTS